MRSIVTPFLALPLLVACVGDVGEGKVKAEIEEPPAAEKQAPAAEAKGKTVPIDVAASSIKALGAKVTATHPIDFHKWKGAATVDGKEVTDLDFTIEMDSLEADHPKLTGHLKNEDFFDVAKFPEASFDATAIKAGADGDWTHTVTGDLTIHGQTKRVTFPAKIAVSDTAVVANTEFTINRQDFAITYKGKADDLIQDNVVLTIAFTAPMS